MMGWSVFDLKPRQHVPTRALLWHLPFQLIEAHRR
jgi:hypothetical protein